MDTVAPNTTIDSNPAALANSTSARFTFSSNETGSTFECKLDSGAYESCTSPKSYSSLSQGSHTFSVRATDAAGNIDATPASYTWTVDTVAPNTTIDTKPTDPLEQRFAELHLLFQRDGLDLRVQARQRRLRKLHLSQEPHGSLGGFAHLLG